jgi:hypothetical protein
MDAMHEDTGAWELIDGSPIRGAPALTRRDRRRFVRRARRHGLSTAAIAEALGVAAEDVAVLAAEDPAEDGPDEGDAVA